MQRLNALVQGPPLAFADGSHATFDVQVRFSVGELFDGLEADGSVEVRVELLVGGIENANVSAQLAQTFALVHFFFCLFFNSSCLKV